MATNKLTDVEAEIQTLTAVIAPLARRLEELRRAKRKIESENWIAANRVKRDDIELSSGKGKPWFGDVWKFSDWLKKHSTKRFCEWNGRIHYTAEIISGRMAADVPATMDEVPCLSIWTEP